MFTHILFPSDLSKQTQAAFEQLMELALAFKAKVTLFHAYQLLSTSVAGAYDISITSSLLELEQSMADKAVAHLNEFKARLSAAGVEAEILIERGNIGEQIVEAAENRGCDLILMGSRGLGPVRSILMGSTSTYVLHHSGHPILVIPTPEA